MGVITNKIKFAGSKGEKEVEALYDSGANHSFIKESLAEQPEVIVALPKPIESETAQEGKNFS